MRTTFIRIIFALLVSAVEGIALVLALPIAEADSQSQTAPIAGKVQIEGFVDFNTSARIYPASRDADPSINSTYNSLGGFLSPGADVRIALGRSNFVGITTQVMRTSQTLYNIYGYNGADTYVGVPVNDGLSLWLLELNGYFNIPILGERWNVYLGGGPGLYLGKRDLRIGNSEATTPTVFTGGIQVAVGLTFKLTSDLGIRTEMKFRSPDFNTTSSFNSTSTIYDGLRVSLPNTQYGKVNLDGDDFTLGIFWEL